jgi:hypothetical protein
METLKAIIKAQAQEIAEQDKRIINLIIQRAILLGLFAGTLLVIYYKSKT